MIEPKAKRMKTGSFKFTSTNYWGRGMIDLSGHPLIDNQIIIPSSGGSVTYHCGNEGVRSDRADYIRLHHPDFWKHYHPNTNGRISVLVKLGPYWFLVSQSITNISKLFKFLDEQTIIVRDQNGESKKTGKLDWKWMRFNKRSEGSNFYFECLNDVDVYSQADFNYMLTWLTHNMWLFPTDQSGLKPINRAVMELQNGRVLEGLREWKMCIKLVNTEYKKSITLMNFETSNKQKRNVITLGDGKYGGPIMLTLERNIRMLYNWRNLDSPKSTICRELFSDVSSYMDHNCNKVLIPRYIYTHKDFPYREILKNFRELDPKKQNKKREYLPDGYFLSSSINKITLHLQQEQWQVHADHQVWGKLMSIVHRELNSFINDTDTSYGKFLKKKPAFRDLNQERFRLNYKYIWSLKNFNQPIALLPKNYQYTSISDCDKVIKNIPTKKSFKNLIPNISF